MDWTFSRTERLLLFVLCGALVVGGALLGWQQWRVRQARHELNNYLLARAAPPVGADEAAPVGVAAAAAAGVNAPADEVEAAPKMSPLFVHVAGAVRAPGVFVLPADARAVDAVDAAGGAADDADLDGINLAAPLADGQRLYIPRQGEAPVIESETDAAGSAGSAGNTGSNGLVNVNRADAAALQRVPGIGPVLATRIIAYRTTHGPFQRLEDLTKVSGIGSRTLGNIAPYINVDGQP